MSTVPSSRTCHAIAPASPPVDYAKPGLCLCAERLERLGEGRDPVGADDRRLDGVRLALEIEHGPGDRRVREVE